MSGNIRVINDIGIGFKGDEKDLIRDIRIYEESGSVQFWVEVKDRRSENTMEALQYLSAQQAMDFANALKRCAIRALENSA